MRFDSTKNLYTNGLLFINYYKNRDRGYTNPFLMETPRSNGFETEPKTGVTESKSSQFSNSSFCLVITQWKGHTK